MALSAHRTRLILLPLATSAVFSGSYIAAKITTAELGPLTTTLFRYGVALVFLTVLLFNYKISVLKLRRRDICRVILLGATGVIGYHYFFFLSLNYTEVLNTAIINALSPILTGVAAAIIFRERLRRKNYVGILLALIGVIVLLTRGKPATLLELAINRGDGLMLLSTLSWMVYTLLIKKLLERYHGFTLTYYATLFAVIGLLFLALPEGYLAQLRVISTRAMLAVLYMGICASGLGYLLYNLSIKEIGPTQTSSFVYSMLPLLVAGLSYLFFGQTISLPMVTSAALIILGLKLMLTPR